MLCVFHLYLSWNQVQERLSQNHPNSHCSAVGCHAGCPLQALATFLAKSVWPSVSDNGWICLAIGVLDGLVNAFHFLVHLIALLWFSLKDISSHQLGHLFGNFLIWGCFIYFPLYFLLSQQKQKRLHLVANSALSMLL